MLASDYREASALSRKRISFALAIRDGLEGARVAVDLYGMQYVRQVHAHQLAEALRGRIPSAFYARMFIGGGFAAAMARLEAHHGGLRACEPERRSDTDEAAMGAFVMAAAGVGPAPLDEAPAPAELPSAPLQRAALTDEAGGELELAPDSPPPVLRAMGPDDAAELERAAAEQAARSAAICELAEGALHRWGPRRAHA